MVGVEDLKGLSKDFDLLGSKRFGFLSVFFLDFVFFLFLFILDGIVVVLEL